MAIIKFLPVCSACGARINGIVDYNPVELQGASNRMLRFNDYVITPPYCSNCGEPFEAIVMYTRLPYGGENDE